MATITKVHWTFGDYTKEDLMQMDPVPLGGLFRERTHHNVEVPLYPTLLKWKGKPIDSFGKQAQIVFDVWKERGFSEDTPDVQWAKQNLAIAAKIRAGEKVTMDEALPVPFTDEEMAVVYKLIYTRRSIRDWVEKEVPDDMIEKILEAGRAAPIGCNMGHVKFIVLKDPEEKKMIWSDIPTVNAAIIVICHDKRIPAVVGQDKFVPQNPGFDAAAAGDHMLLMAHALGLGACWLSSAKETSKTKDTAKLFKEAYGLPDYIEVDLHIGIGWTAIGSIKSGRPALKDLIIRRQAR
jgi:nitroreductase